MPMLVLSSKLCPSGIEGTFFALLMSIDNVGLLSASWGGGFVLHILRITRTRFDNIWLAILIRNILRITPLWLLFLVPRADPTSSILPTTETMDSKVAIETSDTTNVELVSLVHSVDAK
ncbi:Folate-biopterin transporter [Vigna unguiculata]|nr:Folate-biopterin transporter [Vigna unguiculata]